MDRKYLAAIMAVVVIGLSAYAMEEAEASHFRQAHFNWRIVAQDATTTTVEFSGSEAWRLATCGGGNIGDIFSRNINFGDGGGFQTIWFEITSIDTSDPNVNNHWCFARLWGNSAGTQPLQHTYTTADAPFTAFIDSCCRIADLENAPGGSFRVETDVNFVGGNTQSPVATASPFVLCPPGVCQFTIPAIDGDPGDSVMFRKSTSAESDIFDQSFYTIDANTGQITFNPSGASIGDQYALSVAVLEKNNEGTEIGRVTVDFIVRISDIQNIPPEFVDPTPIDATFVRAADGSTIEFDVKCSDPDGGTVTINALNTPVGSTFPNGVSGVGMVSGTFSWIPPSTGVAAIAFTCTDNLGGAAIPTTITIQVLPICEEGQQPGEECLPEGVVIGLPANACEIFASAGVGKGENNPPNVQGALGKVGPNINGFSMIGNPTMEGYGMPGIAFDVEGNLYGATAQNSDPGMLLLIDQNTGALIEDLGIFTEDLGEGIDQFQLADLTVSPENQMYGVKRDGSGDLYKIFPDQAENGQVPVEFAGNIGEGIRGLAFLKDGTLVASQTVAPFELIEILLDADGDVTGTKSLVDLSTNYNGLGVCPDGTLMATHIVNSHETWVINPETGEETLVGFGDYDLSDLDAPIFVPVGESTGGDDHEPPTIGKSLDGVRQVVTNGIGIDGQTWTVTKDYHQEFELIEMLTSPHTITNEIFCNEGYQECNHVIVAFMGLDEYFPTTTMKVEAHKTGQDWQISWSDPNDFIKDPDDENDPQDITFTSQVIDEKRIGTSFTIDFRNKDTGQLKLGIQVRDMEGGVRNFYFNEGVKFMDADAYPATEASFDTPLEVDRLCLNEDPDYRNSCAFAQKRQEVTQRAEETLKQMMENQYRYHN